MEMQEALSAVWDARTAMWDALAASAEVGRERRAALARAVQAALDAGWNRDAVLDEIIGADQDYRESVR